MAEVVLRGLKKIYDKSVLAVQDFNLTIYDKEFVVLVGPSGCGKSTVLRMIAGLEEITAGEIEIDGRIVNDLPPKERDIAMVFQNYALYPHMTVYDNMAFSLKLRKEKRKVIDARVRQAADILAVSDLLQRKPKALSGGQRQRVAIGRAIVREPRVFLMDEPLSNLDAKLRNQMRTELILLRERIDTTFIYVTHDQTEAMTLGDRIVVMRDGLLQQSATPQEVFNHPANLFVATFIGTPQMNLLEAELLVLEDRYFVQVSGATFALPEETARILREHGTGAQEIIIGIRPEQLILATAGESALPFRTDVCERMGSTVHVHGKLAGQEAVAVFPTSTAEILVRGATTWLSFRSSDLHLFSKQTEKNLLP